MQDANLHGCESFTVNLLQWQYIVLYLYVVHLGLRQMKIGRPCVVIIQRYTRVRAQLFFPTRTFHDSHTQKILSQDALFKPLTSEMFPGVRPVVGHKKNSKEKGWIRR